jgi:hypothetical protein
MESRLEEVAIMKKRTNYEGMFFGMIVLAWALLAVVFNIMHHELPQSKNPADAKTVTANASLGNTLH